MGNNNSNKNKSSTRSEGSKNKSLNSVDDPVSSQQTTAPQKFGSYDNGIPYIPCDITRDMVSESSKYFF